MPHKHYSSLGLRVLICTTDLFIVVSRLPSTLLLNIRGGHVYDVEKLAEHFERTHNTHNMFVSCFVFCSACLANELQLNILKFDFTVAKNK